MESVSIRAAEKYSVFERGRRSVRETNDLSISSFFCVALSWTSSSQSGTDLAKRAIDPQHDSRPSRPLPRVRDVLLLRVHYSPRCIRIIINGENGKIAQRGNADFNDFLGLSIPGSKNDRPRFRWIRESRRAASLLPSLSTISNKISRPSTLSACFLLFFSLSL